MPAANSEGGVLVPTVGPKLHLVSLSILQTYPPEPNQDLACDATWGRSFWVLWKLQTNWISIWICEVWPVSFDRPYRTSYSPYLKATCCFCLHFLSPIEDNSFFGCRLRFIPCHCGASGQWCGLCSQLEHVEAIDLSMFPVRKINKRLESYDTRRCNHLIPWPENEQVTCCDTFAAMCVCFYGQFDSVLLSRRT